MWALVNKHGTPIIRDVTKQEAEDKKTELGDGYDDAPFHVIDQDNIPDWVLREDEELHWHEG